MLESAKVIEATLNDALDDALGLRDDEGPEDEAFDATVIGRRRARDQLRLSPSGAA